jgi:hypothetical protein
MKKKAFLFGPFFGELSWEYFRFAPYAIHLKKNNPKTRLIVYTRSSRFDLYGKYSDILVPLNIPKDEIYKQNSFKLCRFNKDISEKMKKFFHMTYEKKFDVEHYCPDFSSFRYNLKWQFPRRDMDYDFNPRNNHSNLIQNLIPVEKFVIVDEGYKFSSSKYYVIRVEKFMRTIMEYVDNRTVTYMGCLIELIKKSTFTVSDLNSDTGRLSLLLKKPLIYPRRKLDYDSISLLNPYKTPIIDCDTALEGVMHYENNF